MPSSSSKIYIAGVGFSPSPSRSSQKDAITTLVSAATKALLDAGITYDDVTGGIRSKSLSRGSEAFKAFDEDGVTIDEVPDGSELDHSISQIQSGTKCVLMIAMEESNAIAFVLGSEDFLWRRPYLKDSSILIEKHKPESRSKSDSNAKSNSQLYEICQMVWLLRGWSNSNSNSKSNPSTHKPNNSITLRRADSKSAPEWATVEHRQDGKHRLGYNPATETREISREDFEAVRGSGGGSGSVSGSGNGSRGNQGKARDSGIENQFKRKGGDRAALARL